MTEDDCRVQKLMDSTQENDHRLLPKFDDSQPMNK